MSLAILWNEVGSLSTNLTISKMTHVLLIGGKHFGETRVVGPIHPYFIRPQLRVFEKIGGWDTALDLVI